MVTPRREASPTVGFIDDYCQAYQNLFSDVRNYEAFKLIHLGMLSEIPRKSLTKIARAVGLKDSQGLNYFLSEADWDVKKVREIRLWLTKLFIGEREIILCLDETGDVKKAVRPWGFSIRQGTRTKTEKQRTMYQDNILVI